MGKVKKKHLQTLGFERNTVIKIALHAINGEHFKPVSRERKLEILEKLLKDPQLFLRHEQLSGLANELYEGQHLIKYPQLKKEAVPFKIYGEEGIANGAIEQMNVAAKLPITVGAALMPDAHLGYGLPIGGVLATEGAIIPYAVGVDIGCRMCLSVYDIPVSHLEGKKQRYLQYLQDHTTFGAGKGPEKPMDDEVLERGEFQEIGIVKQLKDKAARQIGSSGGGNHFVEFGIAKLSDPHNEWNLPIGEYLAILSHSGSRGLGAGIAQHYTRVAIEQLKLPKEAKHLAWLDLDSTEGMEYWKAMNLAGDYASACHRHIHQRLSKAIGEKPLAIVENHHNFAWKESWNEKEVIIHRKGATPAGNGVLGIIPGSMTAPGFIVRGKGNASSLSSASHGAGRQLSRRKALNSITKHQLKKVLKEHQVSLLGGNLDEAPMAYKDIHQVMQHQHQLVDIVGQFQPRLVRMDRS